MRTIIRDLVECANRNAVPEGLKQLEASLGLQSVLDGAFGIVTCLFGIPICLPYDLNAFWPGSSRAPAFNAGIRAIVEASVECSEVFATERGILDFREAISPHEREEIIRFVKSEYRPVVNL